MSQIYKSIASGPIPPSIPTTFHTPDGNATPAANIINFLSDDTTANFNNGITDTGSGNTVTYLLTNRLQGTTTTAAATTSPMVTFTPTAVGTYAIECRVCAYNTTSSLGSGYSIFGTARFDGVNSNLCGTPDKIVNEEGAMSAANVTMTVSGPNVLINGVGYAPDNINWSAVGLYTYVGA